MPFPSPATNGQTYTAGGFVYTFNATNKTWVKTGYASNVEIGNVKISANASSISVGNTSLSANGLFVGNTSITSNSISTGNILIVGGSLTIGTTTITSDFSTSNVSEGSNLYYTNARVLAGITKANVTNLTVTGNVIAGNVIATKFIGDGSQLSGITATSTSSVSNLAQLPTYNGNALLGNIVVTGNASSGNILIVQGNASITGNLVVGNVIATRFVGDGSQLTGITATSASSVSNLAQLPTYNGNALLGNLVITGNATTGNILIVQGNASITGNLVVGNVFATRFIGDGSQLTGISTSIVSEGTNLYYTNARVLIGVTSANIANLTITGNIVAGNVFATRFVGDGSQLTGIAASSISGINQSNLAQLPTYNGNALVGNIVVSGNATTGNILTVLGNASITGNLVVGNVFATRFVGDGSQLAGINTSIVSEGTNLYYTNARVLTGVTTANIANLTITGNVISGNIIGTLFGSGSGLTGISTSIVSEGTNLYYTNARVISGVTSANIANLTITGNIVAGNVFATRFVGDGSQLTGITASGVAGVNRSNLAQLPTYNGNALVGNIVVTGNATLGNILVVQGNASIANLVITGKIFGDGSGLTGIVRTGDSANFQGKSTTDLAEGTNLYYTNARVYSNVTSLLANYSGNIRAGNVLADSFVSTGTGVPTIISDTNINLYANNAVVIANSVLRLRSYSTADRNNIVGQNGDLIYNSSNNSLQIYSNGGWVDVSNITTNSVVEGTNLYYTNARVLVGVTQANISNLTVTGNIVAGNVYATRFIGDGSQLTGITATSTSSVSNLAQLPTYNGNALVGNIVVTGNATLGNVLTVIGNAVITGNLVVGNVFATRFVGDGSQLTGITATSASSVSNLAQLPTYNGNALVGNLVVSGNATLGNVLTVIGNAVITGNLVVGNVFATRFIGDGSQLTGITASGGASVSNLAQLPTYNGNALIGNLIVSGNATLGNVLTVIGNAVITGNLVVGNVIATRYSGNGALLTGLNTSIVAEGSNLYYTNARVLAFISNTSISNLTIGNTRVGNLLIGTSVLTSTLDNNTQIIANAFTYTFSDTGVASFPGNITASNVIATKFIGDGSGLTNITVSGGGSVSNLAQLPTYNGNALLGNLVISGNATTGNILVVIGNALITGNVVAGNVSATRFVGDGSQLTGIVLTLSGQTTSNLAEGTNLYYTNARVIAGVAQANIANLTVTGNIVAGNVIGSHFGDGSKLTGITTSIVAEGTNLYYTNARVINYITNVTISNLTVSNVRLDQYSSLIASPDNNTTIQANAFNYVFSESGFAILPNVSVTTNIIINDKLVVSPTARLAGNIVPLVDNVYNLGSPTNRFRSLYVSGSTIDMGSAQFKFEDGKFKFQTSDGSPAQTEIYTSNVIEQGDTTTGNVYFTNTRARSAFSEGTGVTYDKTTGVIGIGQNVSTTASVSFRDITLSGNLTVLGTTTTINARELSISDNMIYLNQEIPFQIVNAVGNGANVVYTTALAHGAIIGETVRIAGISPISFNTAGYNAILAVTSNTITIASAVTDTYISGGNVYIKRGINPDLGFTGGYNDGTGYAHTGFFRDATDGTYKIFEGYLPEPDANIFIDTSNSSFRLANLLVSNLTARGNIVAGNILATSFVGDGSRLTGITASGVAGVNTSNLAQLPTYNGNALVGNIVVSGNATTGNVLTVIGSALITGNLITGNITATRFVGDGSQLTGITASAVSGVNTSNLAQLPTYNGNALVGNIVVTGNASTGNVLTVIGSAVITGNLVVGNVTATRFVGDGSQLTGILTSLAGQSTSNLAEGSNLYFTNSRAALAVIPATTQLVLTTPVFNYNLDQYSGDNPTIYVTAGETISFELNQSSSHPFAIRVSNGGSNYDTGLTHIDDDGTVSTGSGAQGKYSGKLFWKIPYSLAGNTYVYQCTVHSSMVGNIVIQSPIGTSVLAGLTTSSIAEGTNLYYTNARVIAGVSQANISNLTITGNVVVGNVFATRFVGDGSQLTGITASGISGINQSNLAQLPTYNGNALVGNIVVTGNASTGNILVVQGNASITGNLVAGNVTATRFVGDGSQLTGIITSLAGQSTSNLAEGTNLYYTNARVLVGVTTANIANLTVTGNVVVGNIFATRFVGDGSQLTGITASGGASVSNLAQLPTYNGNALVGNIVISGNATTGNVLTVIGNAAISGNLVVGNLMFSGGAIRSNPDNNTTIIAGAYQYKFTDIGSAILPNVNVSGNIIATRFIGDGSLLTNVLLSLAGQSTSNLAEGTNLYYTNARVISGVASANIANLTVTGNLVVGNVIGSHFGSGSGLTGISTSIVSEGTNLYYTNARVISHISNITIGNLTVSNVRFDPYSSVIASPDNNTTIQANGFNYVFSEMGVAVFPNLTISSNININDKLVVSPTARLAGNIVPLVDNVYSLGSATNRFKGLYVSGGTIDIGSALFKFEDGKFKFQTSDGAPAQTEIYTGNVIESGDTTLGNVYFTNTRARVALSGSTGVTYDKTTGVISIGQNVSTTANVSFGDIISSGNVVTGNVIATKLFGDGSALTGISTSVVSEGTNLYYTNARVISGVASANIANLTVTSNIVAGNVYATRFIGDGSQLTGVASSGALSNLAQLQTYNGNILVGNLVVTGNATTGNILVVNGNAAVTGNLFVANLLVGGFIGRQGGTSNLVLLTGGNVIIDTGPFETRFFDTGNVAFPSNVIATRFIGDGTGLTGIITSLAGQSTSNLAEGTNLYYTNARVLNYVSNVTLSNLTVSNLTIRGNLNLGNNTSVSTVNDNNTIISAGSFNYTFRDTGVADFPNLNVTGNITLGGVLFGSGSDSNAEIRAGAYVYQFNDNGSAVFPNLIVNTNLTIGGALYSTATDNNTQIRAGIWQYTFTDTGNLLVPNIVVSGKLFGDGSQLTGITASAVSGVNTSNLAQLPTYNGNALVGNIVVSGNASTGNILVVQGNASITGNLVVGNVIGSHFGSGSGLTGITTSIVAEGSNLYYTNARVLTGVTTANIANLTVTSNIVAGNVFATRFVGDGSQLTGIASSGGASTSNLAQLPTYNGNALVGNIVVTGNATSGNALTVLGNAAVTGNLFVANLLVGGFIGRQGGTSNLVLLTGGNVVIDTGPFETRFFDTGNVSFPGNVIASSFFVGNGSLLTGITASLSGMSTYAGNILATNIVVTGSATLPNVTVTSNLTVQGNILVQGNLNLGIGSSLATVSDSNTRIRSGAHTYTFGDTGVATLPNVNVTGNLTLGNTFITTTADNNTQIRAGIWQYTFGDTGVATFPNINISGNVLLGNNTSFAVVNDNNTQIRAGTFVSQFLDTGNLSVGGNIIATGRIIGDGSSLSNIVVNSSIDSTIRSRAIMYSLLFR